MTRQEILQVAKPILFKAEIVRAILDGRKTVTRRVIKSACSGGEILSETPPYKPGDYLYVREAWAKQQGLYWHKAGLKLDGNGRAYGCVPPEKWRPSIHMPKEAARIFLRVTGVRVERLQEITEAGAESEGAINTYGFIVSPEDEYAPKPHTAIEGFKSIWDSTIKPKDRDKYGWAANPWVFVIEFERVEVTE